MLQDNIVQHLGFLSKRSGVFLGVTSFQWRLKNVSSNVEEALHSVEIHRTMNQ